jgi:hypothetical protein
VVVPGMEGYVPMRERQLMTWAKSDGTDRPDWWDVGAVQWGKKGLLGETGGSETAAAPRGEKLPLLGLETPATDFVGRLPSVRADRSAPWLWFRLLSPPTQASQYLYQQYHTFQTTLRTAQAPCFLRQYDSNRKNRIRSINCRGGRWMW